MIRPLFYVTLLSVVSLSVAAAPKLETHKQKLGYTIGYQIGQNLKRDKLDVDVDNLVQAIRDALAGKPSALSREESEATLKTFAHERAQARVKVAQANAAAGKKFLEENKKKKGVVALPSGLQYKVIKAGTGKSPTDDSTVVAHYRGTLINGTEFDSSYSRGKPATFKVSGVIPGWREALKLMKEGAKWKIFIPSNLAYGPTGAGNVIGPNETLIFEVSLLKVE